MPVFKKFHNMMKVGTECWPKRTQVREKHHGTMCAFGFCRRTKANYAESAAVRAAVREFYARLVGSPLGQQRRSIYTPEMLQLLMQGHPNVGMTDIPAADTERFGYKDGSSAFISMNYCPAERGDVPRDPPRCVATLRKKPFDCCELSCETCRMEGCGRCSRCPLHRDSTDRTSTLLALWQTPKATCDETAYFVLDKQAFALKDTLQVIFSGSSTMHRLVLPAKPDETSPWWGCAFIGR